MTSKILLVDDEKSILRFFKKALSEFELHTVSSAVQAIRSIESGETYDIIISDIMMPRIGGLELLDFVQRQGHQTEFILITGFGTIESAVNAMKLGAFDYLTKPIEPETALLVVKKALQLRNLKRSTSLLRNRLATERTFGKLVGQSPQMEKLHSALDRAATVRESNVLIKGETGTGKELAARSIHERSQSDSEAFKALGCGSSTPEELAIALFGGRTRGNAIQTSVFEQAGYGTVFLDDIGSIPIHLQSKLTHCLDTREILSVETGQKIKIRCQIIAASNQNLNEQVKQGGLRSELYYRLNELPIEIPPLRDRIQDIEPLSYSFLDQTGMRSRIHQIGDDAIEQLKQHDWPGNIRELRNLIIAAATLSDGPTLHGSDLPLACDSPPQENTDTPNFDDLTGIKTYSEALELGKDHAAKRYLKALMKSTNGNVSRAAKIAGIERASLHRVLRRFDIDPNLDRRSPQR